MKSMSKDPWENASSESSSSCAGQNHFEDSFVEETSSTHVKLEDSEEYLNKLYSRLNSIKGGSSKKDLIKSLSVVKEEAVARFITSNKNFEDTEESELSANPLLRHVAPHLQALTTTELIHLLKADALQQASEEQTVDSKEDKEN